MDGLREFDKWSRHFLLGDEFINSHNLISGQSMDMVRRKLMLVTIGTWRVNTAARHKTLNQCQGRIKEKQVGFWFFKDALFVPIFCRLKERFGAWQKSCDIVRSYLSSRTSCTRFFSKLTLTLGHVIPKYSDRESHKNCYFVTGHELKGIFFSIFWIDQYYPGCTLSL